MSLSVRLSEDWAMLRWKSGTDPFQRFLKHQHTIQAVESNAPSFTEAKDIYLKAKDVDRPKTFRQAIDRAVNYLTNLHGDRPIDAYTRIEANQLRDAFFERGLSRNSIKRLFATLIAIINFTTKELGLDEIRTFSAIVLGDQKDGDKKKRSSFPADVLTKVQGQCRMVDDQPRWLIALVSDTGMRLSEAVGLVKDDVFLEDNHPYIKLKEHPWRRLKTRSNTRTVPLAGNALWAAKRAMEASTSEFLFPKYCNEKEAKGNSASGALNKWLSPRVPEAV